MKQSIIELVIYLIKIFVMENSQKHKIVKRNLLKLLETETNNQSFLFDYLFYKQIQGVWQWVLLWVPLLEMHFYAITKKNGWIICPIHYKPMIYKRYIDYIFVIFSSKEHLQLFVDYMNKHHKCIKFTSEA